MVYRAIIFDLDGTLRESNPHFLDALHDCLGEMDVVVEGLRWRMIERWVHEYWAQSPEILEDVEVYGADNLWNRFLARLMTHAGHPPQDEDEVANFGAHVRDYFQPESQLAPGALETLETLRATGVTMGVLSNREKPFSDELACLGIDGFFDFTLAAGEVGVWKPQPGIFHEGLARAGGVDPAAALYVGDNYYADIVGAANAGLDSVLIDPRHVFTDVMCPRFERIDEMLDFLGADSL